MRSRRFEFTGQLRIFSPLVNFYIWCRRRDAAGLEGWKPSGQDAKMASVLAGNDGIPFAVGIPVYLALPAAQREDC